MSKDLWIRKLLKLALENMEEALQKSSINEWGESKVYMKMVQQRLNAMSDYIKAKN